MNISEPLGVVPDQIGDKSMVDLVPYESNKDIDLYKGKFLVPSDWISAGVVLHIFGGVKLKRSQPVALAITKMMCSLCDATGPVVSIPLQAIKSVQMADLSGISLPVSTPSGVIDMVPNKAKGVSINYQNQLGTQIELVIYTLSPNAAFEWMDIILEAIQNYSNDLDRAGGISRR